MRQKCNTFVSLRLLKGFHYMLSGFIVKSISCFISSYLLQTSSERNHEIKEKHRQPVIFLFHLIKSIFPGIFLS